MSFRLTIAILAIVGMLHAGPIVVNEYGSGIFAADATHMATTDYIEFAITQNVTSATLAAMSFGDSNANTSQIQGIFKFDKTTLDGILTSAGRSDFLAGTIIVVKGDQLGAQNLTYNPLSSNTTNADAWSIELVAGQGARNVNGLDISFSNNGDVAWIANGTPTSLTDTSGFVSAIGNRNGANGAIGNAVISKFGASSMFNGNLNFGNTLANTGSTTSPSLTVVSGTGTMGATNSTTNSTSITALRTNAFLAPEPSRFLLLAAGLVSILFRRRRA